MRKLQIEALGDEPALFIEMLLHGTRLVVNPRFQRVEPEVDDLFESRKSLDLPW